MRKQNNVKQNKTKKEKLLNHLKNETEIIRKRLKAKQFIQSLSISNDFIVNLPNLKKRYFGVTNGLRDRK